METWVPVDACTLPTADQPLRVAEFDALFARDLDELTSESPQRLVLTFRDRPGLAIGVPAQHADVLAGIAARARAAHVRRPRPPEGP